ncbi:hypothetical protein AgCh_021492 [Apium graveolens]
MTPVVKIMSQTGFIYEKNNFTALVNKGIQQSEDYHKMMDFVKNCKLNYAMLESPTIFCEVVEEMWTTAIYNSTDKTITLTIKGNELCINSDVIKACFKIPDYNVTSPYNDTDITNMLNSMHYALPTSKLSDIRRMGLRKEWSFMCDVVTKVFSGKVSNFDSVNISMLNMLYMLVTDKFYNFSDLVLFELVFKLGELAKRGKNVYYARFFMLLANHLCEEIVLENPNNKLVCWVQERRLIVDLNRANHHKDVPMFYFPVMQAPQVSEVSSSIPTTIPTSTISLNSGVAMEIVSMTKKLPTRASKPTTISKSKSKKTPSGISQKMPVEKPTKAKEGSVKEGKLGEGRGEHQRNPKNKVGELSESQPSHTAVSQQTAVLKKDKSSLLAASSQKDVVIKQSSQPRAQAKKVRDTSSPQTYTRKKKSKTSRNAEGTHTVQTGAKDTVPALSQIQFDVAPINVESQPKSLVIKASHTPYSPTNSLEVDMINTSIPDSPSLTLLGKPKLSASEHHLLDDLLAHLPILSETIVTSVPQISSISTESTIVSLPISFISNLSTDIAHPSSSDCIPTDKPNSSYPSDSITTHSMDITHPSSISAQLQTSIISSAEDLVVVQSLLGMREESVLSERLGCSQAKGEEMSENQQSIDSGLAKGSERSPTLVGEGEGVRVGSQGETLMQQKREHERKAVYQLLAAQGNEEAKKTLNLVHTSESLQRDKAAVNLMSSTAGDPSEEFGVNSNDDDSISFDGSMNLGGDEGPSSIPDLPEWALTKESTPGQFNVSLVKQIMSIQQAIQKCSNAGTKAILQAHLDSLHLMKLHQLRQNLSVDELKKDIADLKTYNSEKLDSVMPYGTLQDLLLRLKRESDAEKKLAKLEDRVQGEKEPSEGEKLQIQISKVIIPSITVSKPPVADGIDLIQAAAANLKVAEKEKLSLINWEKIDEEIQKKFQLVKEPVKSAIHHSQVKQISVNEMRMNYLERGQSSCIKSPKAEMILKPRVNYSKSSLKNPLDTLYETPKPDKKKLLSRSIVFYKDPTDSASKKRIAKIFRNGKEICVAVSTSQQIPSQPSEATESREQVEEQKKSPRKKELAKRTKRKLDIVDKELGDQFPKKPTPTTTQASNPSVPIEWDNIPIPDFSLPILSKPKRTKSRAVKKVKLSPLKSKSVVKVQPKVNKGDYLYLCDIKEFSDLNLYLDELDEVRGIDAYRNLPERLVFKYKRGKEIQWPLHRILQESQVVLIKVYSSFKKNFGFNVTARRLVLKKIEELRSVRAKDALPKTLIIPYTGRRVHLRPYWLMEFKDDKGVRRFFRLEDQLSISSNETLLEMQEKLNLSESGELEFHRYLQNQIDENNRKLGRKSRPSRN